VDEPIIIACLGLVGAVIVATPGYLAWRASTANTNAARAAATSAANAEATAKAVAAAVASLSIAVDGRLSKLLEVTEDRATLQGHAEGVAAEQSRTRSAEK